MATNIERVCRWVALAALLASAALFAWYGVSVGQGWLALLPFFGGFFVAWATAAAGIGARRWWGTPFGAGVSVLTLAFMVPGSARLEVALFVGVQLTLLTALGTRAMAEKELGRPLDGERTWRHSALAFGGGLAVPWLCAGLLPGFGWLGAAGTALAVVGLAGAFRGRTWGLAAILLAVPFLLAVPPAQPSCAIAPHDLAGEVAAITLGAASLAWLAPIVERLRGS